MDAAAHRTSIAVRVRAPKPLDRIKRACHDCIERMRNTRCRATRALPLAGLLATVRIWLYSGAAVVADVARRQSAIGWRTRKGTRLWPTKRGW
jgi:hypothetical protein